MTQFQDRDWLEQALIDTFLAGSRETDLGSSAVAREAVRYAKKTRKVLPEALTWQSKPAEIPRGGFLLYGAFGEPPEYRVVEWAHSETAGHHAWCSVPWDSRERWVSVRDPKAWIVLESMT